MRSFNFSTHSKLLAENKLFDVDEEWRDLIQTYWKVKTLSMNFNYLFHISIINNPQCCRLYYYQKCILNIIQLYILWHLMQINRKDLTMNNKLHAIINTPIIASAFPFYNMICWKSSLLQKKWFIGIQLLHFIRISLSVLYPHFTLCQVA